MAVRTRIAPSPTGDPHVGLAYITLFNFVFTKQMGGELVLRIEDTDRSRYRSPSQRDIMETLKWLGLEWDEGPDKGGKFGPYLQSERRELYRENVEKLLEKGCAYRCFCSADELTAIRKRQREKGKNVGYDGTCLSLTNAQIEERLSQGQPCVVRFKVPREGSTKFHDLMRGEIEISNDQIDDQVLLKSDGMPTYHLANVVDDHCMRISHVIRAEEWISSTPKHVLLYEAFGWEQPVFAHMPLLRNADKTKISKRKNPTSLLYYKQKGILPKAMLNFLGLMGWSLDGSTEIFSLAEMIREFDFRKVHLGGPVFDMQKLLWLNKQYIQDMDKTAFIEGVSKVLSPEYLAKIYPLSVTRLESFDQFVENNHFFFTTEIVYGEGVLRVSKKPDNEIKAVISSVLDAVDSQYEWELADIDQLLATQKSASGWKPKEFFMTLRMVVSGTKNSPPLNEMIQVLGRERVRARLRHALEVLKRS